MGYISEPKESMSFRKTILPGTRDVLAERVKTDGTIEEIRVRFYQGQQKALKVFPFVERKGQKIESLITYVETSDKFLSGDDDYFKYPVIKAVEYDDYVKVEVENTSDTYAYTLAVDIIVDYENGRGRA